MQENKVPEKIYISPIQSISGGYVYTTVNKDFPNAVEYARTDALTDIFIEKACKAYCKTCKMPNCYSSNNSKCKFVNTFKKYMKGE